MPFCNRLQTTNRGGEYVNTGNKGGRPPKFKSPEEMQKKIDDYFIQCDGKVLTNNEGKVVLDKYGNPVVTGAKPPTVTGLALALGFTSRQALLNYQAKPKFIDTIMRAKSRCEEYAESRLYDREGVRGATFSLTNNFKGWSNCPEQTEESEVLKKAKEILEGVNSVI